MTRTRRALVLSAMLLAAAAAGGLAEYRRACAVAGEFLGPLPADVRQFHAGLIPLRPAPVSRRLAWAVAYGPRAAPGHVGFEVYVAPLGGVVETNPPGLPARFRVPSAGAPPSSPPAP